MERTVERVSYLEGRVEEQTQMVNSVREAIGSLELRMDRRFDQVDQRFASIDQRFLGIDQRLDGLDAKMSRQFIWLVGLISGCLIAIIGGLSGVITAMAQR